MSDFLQKLEAKLSGIPSHQDVDVVAITKDILGTVKRMIDAQDARIADLEKALNDTVDHLIAGNTDAAKAVASAAVGSGQAVGQDGASVDTDAGPFIPAYAAN